MALYVHIRCTGVYLGVVGDAMTRSNSKSNPSALVGRSRFVPPTLPCPASVIALARGSQCTCAE